MYEQLLKTSGADVLLSRKKVKKTLRGGWQLENMTWSRFPVNELKLIGLKKLNAAAFLSVITHP